MKTVRPVSLAGMRIALGVAAVMQGAPAGLRRLRSALLATLLVLLAACGAEPDDPLTHAVEVTPAAPVIARGTTLQLAATARRTDGTTRPVTGPELSKKLWPGERPPSGRQPFRNPHPACRLDRHTRGKCPSQRRAGAPAQTNVPSKVEAVARRLDLACRAPIGARRQRPFDATNGQQCDARPTRMVCAFSTSAERAHEQKLAGASNPKSNPPPMHLLFLLRKLTIFGSLTATAAAQNMTTIHVDSDEAIHTESTPTGEEKRDPIEWADNQHPLNVNLHIHVVIDGHEYCLTLSSCCVLVR